MSGPSQAPNRGQQPHFPLRTGTGLPAGIQRAKYPKVSLVNGGAGQTLGKGKVTPGDLRSGDLAFRIQAVYGDNSGGLYSFPAARLIPGADKTDIKSTRIKPRFDEENQRLIVEINSRSGKKLLEMVCHYDPSSKKLTRIECEGQTYSLAEIEALHVRLNLFRGGVEAQALSEEALWLFEQAGVTPSGGVFTVENISEAAAKFFSYDSYNKKACEGFINLMGKLSASTLKEVIRHYNRATGKNFEREMYFSRYAEPKGKKAEWEAWGKLHRNMLRTLYEMQCDVSKFKDKDLSTEKVDVGEDGDVLAFLSKAKVSPKGGELKIPDVCKAMKYFFEKKTFDPALVEGVVKLIWKLNAEDFQKVIYCYEKTDGDKDQKKTDGDKDQKKDFFHDMYYARWGPGGTRQDWKQWGTASRKLLGLIQYYKTPPRQTQAVRLPVDPDLTKEAKWVLDKAGVEMNRGFVTLDGFCEALYYILKDGTNGKKDIDGFFALVNGRSYNEMAWIESRFKEKYGKTITYMIRHVTHWPGANDDPKPHALARVTESWTEDGEWRPTPHAKTIGYCLSGEDWEYGVERAFYGLSREQAKALYHRYNEYYEGSDMFDDVQDLSDAELIPISPWVMSVNLEKTAAYLNDCFGSNWFDWGTDDDGVDNVLVNAKLGMRRLRDLLDIYNHYHGKLSDHIMGDESGKREQKFLDIIDEARKLPKKWEAPKE